jgi:hypothetical protein
VKKLQHVLLCLVLCAGAMSGIRMRPDEIEELMRTMNQPKLVRKFAVEDRDDDPPRDPIGGFRIS